MERKTTDGSLHIYTRSYLDGITISANGNIGIGTTTPSERLQVVGTLNASNIVVPGTVNATAFIGDGTYLINVVGSNLANNSIADGKLETGISAYKISENILVKSADYAINPISDSYINASGTTTITLPNPALAVVAGHRYTVRKSDVAGTVVTVTPFSGTIAGESSYPLTAQGEFVTVMSDGTNYFVVGLN